jgi:DNA-binding CsgD family transcriptional regulator
MTRGRPRHDDILTPREWEVLDLIHDGLTNEEIGRRLGISFDTAKFHVSEILSKLGVSSRRDAGKWARSKRKGLLAVLPLMPVQSRESFLRTGAVVYLGATLTFFFLVVAIVSYFSMTGGDNPPPSTGVRAPGPMSEEDQQELLEFAAAKTGSRIEWLRVVSSEPMIWYNRCYDFLFDESVCPRQLTPGYRVRVGYEFNGQLQPVSHEFRTDAKISSVSWHAKNEGEGTIVEITDRLITFSVSGIYDRGLTRGEFQLVIAPGSDVLLDTGPLLVGDYVQFGFDDLPSADIGVLVWVSRADP